MRGAQLYILYNYFTYNKNEFEKPDFSNLLQNI